MGTRSLTNFYDAYDSTKGDILIVTLYRQYDGYVEGHGRDLAKILGEGKVTNGIRDASPGAAFNGAGDAAVRVIASLKTDSFDGIPNQPGNFYILRPGAINCGEEYIYDVFVGRNNITVKVYSAEGWQEKTTDTRKELIFAGTPEKLSVATGR